MVMTKDSKLVMAVVPASHRVDLDRLAQAMDIDWVRLATEEEFRDAFPSVK